LVWQAQSLAGLLPGLAHGFTGALPARAGATFAEAMHSHLAKRFGAPALPLQLLDQRHSAEIVEGGGGMAEPVTPEGGPEAPHARADGAILSRRPGIVAVRSADCVPILAVHSGRGAVAALHAGWRGAAAGILPRLLRRWIGPGEHPRAIRLAFGPAIRACCYEVRADCTSAFAPSDLAGAVILRDGRMYLELTRALRNQAAAFGIGPDAIEISPHCTCCHGLEAGEAPFASFRRDGRPGSPYPARNASYIGLLPR
jgi:YfiH family protein